jgi:internalin A
MDEQELIAIIEQAARDRRTDINLSNKGITAIPTEIEKLTNLQYLNFSGNQLTVIPIEIEKLIDLQKLYLYNNQITTIPTEIKNLINLQELDLINNQITTIPTEIENLINLQKLFLNNNQITTIPTEIENLINLQKLFLNNNQITTIPTEIENLINLQELDLCNNQITAIPTEIENLTNLQILYLSSNQITAIPTVIDKLINLQILDLCNNQITAIPTAISKLTNLQQLNLSYNQINAIPTAINKLTSLQGIYFNNNQITTIPTTIDKLTNLKELYLNNNQINFIPTTINKLNKLKRLVLENNPISNILPEIIRQGWGENTWDDGNPQVIFEYLKSTANQPLNEVKVLLVGEGDVGKTSLLNRLVHNTFNPAETKTPGINIRRQWQLPHGDPSLRLNLWDFGGQRVMHSSHQFFLTKRSLYLLVIDNRKNEQQNGVEYWLKLIETYGGDSPIIIIGNCADEHPLQVKERTLRKKYPQIKKVIATSCQDGTGIDDLCNAIATQINNISHIRDPIPTSWLNIKNQLEEMQSSYDFISYEKYQDICAQSGIGDPSYQKNLMGILNDLGVVLNFQDDLRLNETNVLNPEWVTSGVYDIINNNALTTEKKGILDISTLNSILKDPQRYPGNKRHFLMGLMEKFELCYPLDSHRTPHYLISDLLPIDEPDVDDLEDAPLHFQYHYDILPSSIISSFIVRNHNLIYKNTRWRSGAVLIQDANKALVRADEEDNFITIKVQGRSANTLLATIRSDFAKIHDKFSDNLAVQEKLVIREQDNTDREVPVDYNYLCELEDRDIQESPLPNLQGTYSISDLLAGVESSHQRKTGLAERQNRSRKSREGRPMKPFDRRKRPSLMNTSLVFLVVLFFVAAIFTVIAHFIPTVNLFITVIGIIVVFPVLSIMALMVTGIIDRATLSRFFEGFWTAVPTIAGKKSEQSEKQDNNELPPADDK